MTGPDRLLPSPIDVVNEWAKSRTSITDLVGKRISPVLGALPAIRLTNVGPRDRGPEEALARVQVECWDLDADEADLIARTVVAELPTLRGDFGGGYCAGAGVAMGPFASPDPDTERPRTLLDVELWIYPSNT